jgi:hypothetical protein
MRHSAGKLLIARGDRSVITIIYLGRRDKRCVHVDDQNMHKVAATVPYTRRKPDKSIRTACVCSRGPLLLLVLEILKMTTHETISHLCILYQTI